MQNTVTILEATTQATDTTGLFILLTCAVIGGLLRLTFSLGGIK